MVHSLTSYLFPALAVLLLLTSCMDTEEQSKNKSRDELGEHIPSGAFAIVQGAWVEPIPFRDEGDNYRMEIEIHIKDSSYTHRQLITGYDFETIAPGDTLTAASSRGYWLKNYGKPRNEVLKEQFLFTGIFILLMIVAAVFASYSDQIDRFFANTRIGNTWHIISSWVDGYIHSGIGTLGNLSLFLLAYFILNALIVLSGLQIVGSFPPVRSLFIISSGIILLSVLLMLFNGINNLIKNMRVLTLGAIGLGLIILFSNLILGIDMPYLLESVIGNFVN